MISVKTKDIDGEVFDANTIIKGSGKELIRDFYSLHDVLNKDTEFALLYGIAIKKWESDHENK